MGPWLEMLTVGLCDLLETLRVGHGIGTLLALIIAWFETLGYFLGTWIFDPTKTLMHSLHFIHIHVCMPHLIQVSFHPHSIHGSLDLTRALTSHGLMFYGCVKVHTCLVEKSQKLHIVA